MEPFYNAAISQFLIILGFPLRVIATSGFSQQCEIRAGGKTSEHNTYEHCIYQSINNNSSRLIKINTLGLCLMIN